MREHQTKPNWRDILKINWPKFFKNVNVMKIKERPENYSRCMILDWILDQKESTAKKKIQSKTNKKKHIMGTIGKM